MEQRFGFKDFLIVAMLGATLLTCLLAMVQNDRLWRRMDQLSTAGSTTGRDLAQIRQRMDILAAALQSGHFAQGGSSTGPLRQGFDPFEPLAALPAPADRDPALDYGPVPVSDEAIPPGVDPRWVRGLFAELGSAQLRPDYSDNDSLAVVISDFINTLTPFIHGTVDQTVIEARVLESLASYSPDTQEWLPLLARSWQWARDGSFVRFQLREDVVFSDGTPMTADDVVFTFNFIMNPQIEATRERAYYENIEKVVALGRHEVEFRYRRKYFNFFSLAAGLQIMPKHFYEKFSPEEFNKSRDLLMGTGPYVLDPNWTPTSGTIRLMRNDRYWGARPPFREIRYVVIRDENARIVEFRKGTIDQLGLLPHQFKDLQNDAALVARSRFMEVDNPRSGYSYLGWNQVRGGRPTIFADTRVRQAMTLLTDRQRLIDEIYLGYGKRCRGPFPTTSKQYDPTIEDWPYDRARARALLEQAGWTYDGRAMRNAAGERFRFELMYPSGSEIYEKIVSLLTTMYSQVGIELVPNPTEWNSLLDKLKGQDFDVCALGWGAGGFESDLYQIFHSSQIGENRDNAIGFSNAELDRLIEQARETIDEATRIELWRKAHRILHDEQPYTFLLNRPSLVVFDRRLEGIRKTQSGLNFVSDWTNPYPWFAPAGLERWRE